MPAGTYRRRTDRWLITTSRKPSEIALTQRAIVERRTLTERWDALEKAEADPWSARAEMAAGYLADATAVADLGCATMALERYLKAGTAYHPVDVVRRDRRTIACDFNVAPPPKTPAAAAACLGLIEYLFDPPAFFRTLRDQYRLCAVTYCITDAPVPLIPRRAHAWVNDFARSEIEAVYAAAGWRIDRSEPVGKAQVIWRLT